MMAIQQYTELDERRIFLTTQRQDLVDSIAQTNEAIKRIDETTHARFREAFTAINANFQQTFTTLFGGGRAGLTLLDESDPLESGIDIVASPPGKRLQNVMLLSGGEKALTAIALMFAIFRYKPSPFCLLDEIDAPLDDANIGRFVEMLRGDARPHAVHRHHAQPQDHGDRQPALRRHHGGAGRVEGDFAADELTTLNFATRPDVSSRRGQVDAIDCTAAPAARRRLCCARGGVPRPGATCSGRRWRPLFRHLARQAQDTWSAATPWPPAATWKSSTSTARFAPKRPLAPRRTAGRALGVGRLGRGRPGDCWRRSRCAKRSVPSGCAWRPSRRACALAADHKVTFTIKVPKGVHVDLRTVNGGVRLDNVGGEVRASTTNGGVRGRVAAARCSTPAPPMAASNWS